MQVFSGYHVTLTLETSNQSTCQIHRRCKILANFHDFRVLLRLDQVDGRWYRVMKRKERKGHNMEGMLLSLKKNKK